MPASKTGLRTPFSGVLYAAWEDNRPIILAALLLLVAGYAGQWIIGIPGMMQDVFRLSFDIMLLLLVLPLPVVFLVIRLHVKDDNGRFMPGAIGWRIAIQRFRSRFLNSRSIARALAAGVSITLILNVTGSWKVVIPKVHPFSWDERFAIWDRVLHLGNDPWRLLQPALGSPRVTLFLDDLYFTWLPVVFTFLACLVWFTRGELRTRTLLGIVFVWVGLGGIAATLLSSAGPCFYRFIVPGPNPYDPLMVYLRSVSDQFRIFSTAMQDVAWSLHQTGKADIRSGISAMPSVHVAVPALYALISWHWSKLLAAFFWVYTGLIILATIHLGWHYAIDAYFSVIAVGLFWRLSARLARPAGRQTAKA